MKKVTSLFLALVSIVAILGPISAEAAVRVKGYYKPSTGRYVAPHYKTTPNRTKFDNFSTKGNYNPYSGKRGTVNPYKW